MISKENKTRLGMLSNRIRMQQVRDTDYYKKMTKKQLLHSFSLYRDNYSRIMDENTSLRLETNYLYRSLDLLKKRLNHFTRMAGYSPSWVRIDFKSNKRPLSYTAKRRS